MFRQLTHDGAIQSDETWITWINCFYKDITWVHVCMEKVVTEDLREEDG